MSVCKECNEKISIDEIGLNLKLISREVDDYLCINCLAKRLNISKKSLEDKIVYYKSIGCELFSKD